MSDSFDDIFELFSIAEAKEIKISDTLPSGNYPIVITRAEIKKKDDKSWLSLGCQISEGHEMSGRYKTFSLYLRNGHPNPKVCNIHAKIRQSLDKALALDRMTLENIIGRSLIVKIYTTEKEGNVYENIDRFLAE